MRSLCCARSPAVRLRLLRRAYLTRACAAMRQASALLV
jgi:hypothetical protein